MVIGFSNVVSAVSLVVSVTVAWFTLRRGALRMTQPVQIAFVHEDETNPKIFLRTLLYTTGKRGHVIEGLYLKVQQPDSTQTFAFWGYGERNALMVAGGLRVTDEGIAYNHHFLRLSGDSSYFPEGRYGIEVYARLVNRKRPKLLMTINVALTRDESARLHLERGALFTWNPDTRSYYVSFDMKK